MASTDDLLEEPTPMGNGTFSINAMFPDGQKHSYTFEKNSTIKDLINLIKKDPSINKPEGKRICALYRGRMLHKHDKISELDTMQNFTISILFRMNRVEEPKEKAEEEELRGFDRLRRMDYTPQQIEEIRNQFHFMRGGTDDPQDRKLDAEEEWLPVIFNSENPLESFRTTPISPPITPQQTQIYEDGSEEHNSPWLTFTLSFALGAIFGPASLLFLIVSLRDVPGLAGIISGIIVHFVLQQVCHISIYN